MFDANSSYGLYVIGGKHPVFSRPRVQPLHPPLVNDGDVTHAVALVYCDFVIVGCSVIVYRHVHLRKNKVVSRLLKLSDVHRIRKIEFMKMQYLKSIRKEDTVSGGQGWRIFS